MKKRIIVRLDMKELQAMCIRYDYYTRGNNREYEAMLRKYADADEVTAEQIYELAEDIKVHSDEDATQATVDSIAFNILKEATYTMFM